MAAPDYYALLNVAPGSDPVVIRAAYRALIQKYHPDTCKLPDAAARAQALNEAYAILSHPEKRDAYDNERRRQAEQDTAKPTGQGGPEATASPSNSPTRDRPTSTETKRPDNNGPSTKTKQQGCGCALAFLAFFAGLIAIGSIQSDPAPDNAIDDGATDPMAIAPESAPEAPITTSQEETLAAADLMTFAFTSRQKALVEQYRNEDDECRGGGGGAAKIQHHCAVRNAMDYVMDEAGLCYGKKYDVTMADMEWHLCTNDSRAWTHYEAHHKRAQMSLTAAR